MSLTATLIFFLLFSGSPEIDSTPVSEVAQGVAGVVTYRPGHDGEDMAYYLNPPDLTPRPLKGARVSLREFKGQDQPAGEELVSTITDSAGYYLLAADTGTYFLIVSAGVHAFLRTTGKAGKNFDPEDRINDYKIIEVISGQLVLKHFRLDEMSVE